MATRIIVDGYNLIWAGQGLRTDSPRDLEKTRETLRLKLSQYKKATGHRITVAFDGGFPGGIYPRKKRFAGIEVQFSRPPQKADDLIRDMVRGSGRGSIVVTSDRELASAAEAHGCTAVSSPAFMERVEQAAFSGLKDYEDLTEEEDYPQKPAGTKKRGNPRRPSKKERKRKARLKKL